MYISKETEGKLFGRVIETIEWFKEDAEHTCDGFRLRFVDGGSAKFEVYADCCSHTWIEHHEEPLFIRGATLLGIEGREAPAPKRLHESGDDLLQFYCHVLRTTKGVVTVEYRNESNGYYGGDLYLVELDGVDWRYR